MVSCREGYLSGEEANAWTVGIIAINGDHVAEGADAHELLRFIVTFGMSWKMWTDLTQFIAWFESDDVLQRVEFLFFISCLLG